MSNESRENPAEKSGRDPEWRIKFDALLREVKATGRAQDDFEKKFLSGNPSREEMQQTQEWQGLEAARIAAQRAAHEHRS